MAQASEKWTFEDFFTMTAVQEASIKKDMASLLGVSYGDAELQNATWAVGHAWRLALARHRPTL